MIQSNSLSSSIIKGTFTGGKIYPSTNYFDHELGGIAIQNPSMGLTYQIWSARLENDNIYLSSENTQEYIAYSGSGITEISFTFDQNMNFTLAYVENGSSKLYWYDSIIPGMTVTNFGSQFINPRVSIDDKRVTQTSNSDIIMAYIKNGNLYYRQQRDRFGVEYLLKTGVSKLKKIGMNDKLRLQFLTE